MSIRWEEISIWAFTTTGTTDFLSKFTDSYTQIDFRLMRGDSTTLAYYESDKNKRIFAAGKRYEIVYQWQKLWDTGCIIMEHIPVLKDAVPHFEGNFSKSYEAIEAVPNLLSARLLKEHRRDHYVFITQWRSLADFYDWQKEQEDKQTFFSKKTRPAAYFADRPFTNTYQIIKDKEE